MILITSDRDMIMKKNSLKDKKHRLAILITNSFKCSKMSKIISKRWMTRKILIRTKLGCKQTMPTKCKDSRKNKGEKINKNIETCLISNFRLKINSKCMEIWAQSKKHWTKMTCKPIKIMIRDSIRWFQVCNMQSRLLDNLKVQKRILNKNLLKKQILP